MRKPGDPHIMPDAGAYRVDRGETAVLDIYFSIPPNAVPGKYVFTWIISMGLSRVLASPLTKSDTVMIYALGEEPQYNPLADPLILVPAAVIMLFVIYLLMHRRSKSGYLPEAPQPRRRDRARPQLQRLSCWPTLSYSMAGAVAALASFSETLSMRLWHSCSSCL